MFFYRELLQETLELIANNSAATVFEYSEQINWDNDRGYYRSSNQWSSEVNMNLSDLDQTTKIEATFTGYYNNPANCLGNNYLRIIYTDNTEDKIGTIDAWAVEEGGQIIYKGDAGIEQTAHDGVLRNVIGETYILTVPNNKRVKCIKYNSNYLPGYPEAIRGVKDIKLHKKPIVGQTVQSLPNNSVADIFSPTDYVLWDNDRGYYRSNNDWATSIDVSILNASSIKKIQGTFTGYYNSPANCLGNNYFRIMYTDNTEELLGTTDGDANQVDGQTILKGDTGQETKAIDIISKTYVLSVPPNKTVQYIKYVSNYLSGYPEALRGVKDIKIYRE